MSQKVRGRSRKTDRKTFFLFVSRFFHLSFAPLTLTAMHGLAQNSTSLVRATTIAQLVEHHTHHTEVVGSALSHGKVFFPLLFCLCYYFYTSLLKGRVNFPYALVGFIVCWLHLIVPNNRPLGSPDYVQMSFPCSRRLSSRKWQYSSL